MASFDDSTAPQWQELHPFRSTFLRHILEPETADAIRKTGSFLFAAALEISIFTPASDSSEVEADLFAAVQDLRYLEGFLSTVVAKAVEDLELSTDDLAIASRAVAWASAVGAVAAEIEDALSP